MSDDYKIEKNVQPPHHKGNYKYPFGKMEVGDSFVGDAKARHAANAFNKNNPGVKFFTRTLEDGTIRIWRKA